MADPVNQTTGAEDLTSYKPETLSEQPRLQAQRSLAFYRLETQNRPRKAYTCLTIADV